MNAAIFYTGDLILPSQHWSLWKQSWRPKDDRKSFPKICSSRRQRLDKLDKEGWIKPNRIEGQNQSEPIHVSGKVRACKFVRNKPVYNSNEHVKCISPFTWINQSFFKDKIRMPKGETPMYGKRQSWVIQYNGLVLEMLISKTVSQFKNIKA